MVQKTGLACVLAFLLVSWTQPRLAWADDPPFTIGARPAWFVMAGVSGGGTVAVDKRGAIVGGELSIARINRGRVVGVYADAHYDFGIDAPYLSAGPEFGFSLRDPGTLPMTRLPINVGIDGGIAFRLADETDVGATGRVTLTINGGISFYGRYSYFDSMDNDHVIQVGILLKFPLISPFGAATRGVR